MKDKTTAEFEIEVSSGQITCKQVIPDGKYKLVVEVETDCNQREGIFKKVPASELRLDDEILKHEPQTKAEQKFKNLIETAIKRGLQDFWRPVCDPSFDDNGRICYEPGKKPATGKSYDWWEKNAKEFKPEQGSRLGDKYEYAAFFVVRIKELVASGKSVKWAWNAVCNDSKELGHYWNSENAKHYEFEDTGSREICGFFDLANTFKFLAEDEAADGFWIAGGNCCSQSNKDSLAVLCYSNDRYFDAHNVSSCGWLVLTEGSTDH